jgi:hypothetical protein
MSYEFSCLLSHAVKVYIGAACKIPAQHMSSEEIIDKLLSDSANDWSTMGLLAEVLKTTDSGKYAKRKLSAAQQMGIYKKACRFIILSERSLRRAKPNFTAPD